MNELQIFSNPAFGEVRITEMFGEPAFIAMDVCHAIEIDPSQVRRLDDDEKGMCYIQTPGGEQRLTAVTETGLYSLVLGSRKPEAKSFKRWITHEVLPSIHKHGAYMTPATIEKALLNPDTIIQLATQLKVEMESRKALETETAYQKQVICGFVDGISLSQKRQILNRVEQKP